jgi:hypothetical protein
VEEKNTSIIVNNKDIPYLENVHSVMAQVTHLEERRIWQQDRMGFISQHLTGMPGGGGSPTGLDEAFARLSEIDDEHAAKCKMYVGRLKKAQKILNNIENINMRTFVLMRYVIGASDMDIRKELNMTRRGFDRARKCVESASCMAAVKWHDQYIIENAKNFSS